MLLTLMKRFASTVAPAAAAAVPAPGSGSSSNLYVANMYAHACVLILFIFRSITPLFPFFHFTFSINYEVIELLMIEWAQR